MKLKIEFLLQTWEMNLLARWGKPWWRRCDEWLSDLHKELPFMILKVNVDRLVNKTVTTM